MALLFCDSYDHYSAANMATKYMIPISAPGLTAGGRDGTGWCMRFNNNYTYTAIGNKSTLVVGFGLKLYATNSLTWYKFIEDTTVHIDLRFNSLNQLIVTRNGTVLGTSAAALRQDIWEHLQIKVVIHDSTGAIEVKLNSVTILNLSGIDTKNGLTGVITKCGMCPPSDFGYFDDYWIDDADFLGDSKVQAIHPNGAGDNTTWDPSAGANFECVDEVNADGDTTYVSSLTPDEIDTYEFGNLTATTGLVKGVQALAWARKDDAGARNMALVVRPAATNYAGDAFALVESYAYYRQVWDVNPETAAEWTIAEVNASEFGVKMVS